MFAWLILCALLFMAASAAFLATANEDEEKGFVVDPNHSKVAGVSMIVMSCTAFGLTLLSRILAIGALWLWFVTPTFNIPVPPYGMLYGLMLLIALFRFRNITGPKEKRSPTGVVTHMFNPAGSAALMLCIGWFVKTYCV